MYIYIYIYIYIVHPMLSIRANVGKHSLLWKLLVSIMCRILNCRPSRPISPTNSEAV